MAFPSEISTSGSLPTLACLVCLITAAYSITSTLPLQQPKAPVAAVVGGIPVTEPPVGGSQGSHYYLRVAMAGLFPLPFGVAFVHMPPPALRAGGPAVYRGCPVLGDGPHNRL